VIPLGLFALVVFNRWRICRELREHAWQEWIDSVSAIARQYGIESAVIRLSDRWRNYFERGLSPERAVLQYKSDCMAGHQLAARGSSRADHPLMPSFENANLTAAKTGVALCDQQYSRSRQILQPLAGCCDSPLRPAWSLIESHEHGE